MEGIPKLATFRVGIDKCGDNEQITGKIGLHSKSVDGEDRGKGTEGSAGVESGREGVNLSG